MKINTISITLLLLIITTPHSISSARTHPNPNNGGSSNNNNGDGPFIPGVPGFEGQPWWSGIGGGGGGGGYGFGFGGPSGGYGKGGVIRPTVVCKQKGPCFKKKLTCPAKCFTSYSRSGKGYGGGGGGGGCTIDCEKSCVAYC